MRDPWRLDICLTLTVRTQGVAGSQITIQGHAALPLTHQWPDGPGDGTPGMNS